MVAKRVRVLCIGQDERMIRLATENDYDEVKEIFHNNRKWFPHVRTDYMKRMISKKNLILQDGVLITFHHTKRKQKVGDVQVERGETVLHQIVNKEIGNGKASEVLLEFFEWCPRNVYLSVRSDNLLACKFYDRMDMKLVGIHNWVNGTLKGKVYAKIKSE